MIPSIPTTYNGIKFRSKLEANWAKWFDEYSIKWSYESEGFDVNGIWYLPDFHLPEISTFIEIKGALQGISKARKFFDAIMKINLREDNLSLFPKYLYFLGGSPVPSLYDIHQKDNYYLMKCKKCGGRWFELLTGYYGCRSCGYYDGDGVMAGKIQRLCKPLEWDPPEPEINSDPNTAENNKNKIGLKDFMK